MKTSYLVKRDDKFFVWRGIGTPPADNVGVIPPNVAIEDYPYLKSRLVTDEEQGFQYQEIYIDDDLKDTSLAAKAVEATAQAWKVMRLERDRLLAACDFTQIADAPLTAEEKTAWSDYRQALRDLPSTITDINDFDWPVKPS